MKRILCFALSLLLIISFTACGKTNDKKMATNALKEFKNNFKNPDGFKVTSDVRVFNHHMLDKGEIESILAFDCTVTGFDGSTARGSILLIVDKDGHAGDWSTARTVDECKDVNDVVIVSYYQDAIKMLEQYGNDPKNYPKEDRSYWTNSVIEKDDINNSIK